MPRQPFHLVELSPWPFISALNGMLMALGLISLFKTHSIQLELFASTMMIASMYQWWRDVARESTFMGKHTIPVLTGIKMGMLLFILSEVCFFFAFFWTFFHSSLSPTMEIGCMWPPLAISSINPFSIPLLNTAVLLASGFTVTWAHHCLLLNKRSQCIQAMLITVILGMYFTILQLNEYKEASFSIADSVYGSIFFVATGFHGAHVLIGSSFLATILVRISMNHFSTTHHFGFEASAWYWHFVDVVWICLYLCMYWWGS